MKRSLLLLAMMLVVPVVAQEDTGTYFAITSNRTFAPGEKATIQMWAQGLKSMDFRLYRVDKPSDFLSQLSDAHSFGNQVSDLPKEDTAIARFARWKHSLRLQTVLFVRGQFTPDARASYRQMGEPAADAKPKTEKGSTFAEIPILNPSQLVKAWKENISTKQRWDEQKVDIPVAENGLYLVEATNGKLRAYTLVSVSSMAVITKTQPGQSIARVVDRVSGRALGGVDVEFRSAKKSHGSFKTDANGFAKLVAEDTSDIFVIAAKAKDVAFDSLSEYAFQNRGERRMTGYVYTDRPVYRPGHKIFYKAILRSQAEFGYAIPKNTEVSTEITDSAGKIIHRKDLSLSSFGSVKGEFDLPMTAGLGYYALKVKLGAAESYGGFTVEEYKKPEYDVKIKPSKPRVVQGETVNAVVQAKYFFGEPVKSAKVTYTVRRARYYPPWYDAEDSGFEQTEADPSGGEFFQGEQGEEQEGKLDEQGELSIKLPTPVVDADYVFRIEARVMDEGNREVTGYGLVTATRGSYMAVIAADRYIVEPGVNATYTVTLKDYDSKPISGDFRAELKRYSYNNGKPETLKMLESSSGRTGTDGTAKVVFRLPEAGSYTVTVRSRTPEGRDVTDDAWTWASGYGALFGGGDQESLKIITDKKKYAPGDVAKLLILTSSPDTDLWVTTESRTVIDSKAVRAAQAGGVTVEVPVRSEFAPRVFVTASYLKAGKLFTGQVALRVPAVERELSISLSPSKQEFKPGEPAQYNVEVKDNKGQPARAELSLGIVDEALYAVQRDLVQTPLSFFYGNVYNEVNTSNSLSYYFRGEAGRRAMRLAQIRPSLGQLKPDRVGDPRVRKAFPDTAFWVGDLITDASGKGKVDFAFPDALTMWRTTARGVTMDTKVGMAIDRVIVRKNLMLRMVSPRFLMEGDEVSIGVIVQNYLTSTKETKLSLSATGVDFLDGADRTVSVEAKGTRKVEFKVRVKPGIESVLTAKGITNEESDAMELTIPVKPYGTLLSNGASGALTGTASGKATLQAPGGSSSVEVRIAPSLAGSLFGALEYLTQFPYGCTEQTMSSFLPNVIVSKALDDLKIKANVRRDDLLKKVNAGMERLYDFQHEDGAWGWWKGDESHPFMTAHVVSGLKQAREAGYAANGQAIQRGEKWLRSEFRRQADARSDLRAYMAYALGGKDDVEAVWSARPKMTSYGLAFLGLAFDKLKDPRALEIARELEASAKQSETEAWWPGTRDPLLDFPNDITPETTSYVLKLLSRQRADSPLLSKAAAWLTMHKDQGEWWNSTKQTAMVIYGVTDYLKASGELKPEISATVFVNGKQVLTRNFGEADATAIDPQTITVAALSSNEVEVRVNGRGRVYWNAQARYYTPIENKMPSEGGAMSATREYFRLLPRESAGTTTYSLEPLSGEIKPGDTIAVLLNVSAKDWKYVLIEDPIPAGMELVTNDNTYNVTGKPIWWRYTWAQREYRDDRVAFFRTYFYDERSNYFYVMKAVNPGKFRVPPTRIQPMYQPQQVGTGTAATLEVTQ